MHILVLLIGIIGLWIGWRLVFGSPKKRRQQKIDTQEYEIHEAELEKLYGLKESKEIDELIKYLHYSGPYDGTIRSETVKILGDFKDPNIVESLIAMLNDEDKRVQKNTVDALEKIGWKPRNNEENIYVLFALNKWKEVEKLGVIATNALINVVMGGNTDDAKKALKTLKKIGEPLIPQLTANLMSEDLNIQKKSVECLDKLNWKPSNETEKILHLIAQKKWDEIKKMGKSVVEPLINLLSDSRVSSRGVIAEILGKIGNNRAVEPLISSLKDKDWSVRYDASYALARIKDARAVKPLIATLNDENSSVRSKAEETLKKITGQDFGEDSEKWQEWWEQNKEQFLEDR